MRILRILTAAFAIASGVIVLLGYFVPFLDPLRLVITDWAIIIAGAAVLVGIFNLITVQMEKIRTRQKGWAYGVVLIFALLFTFGFGLLLGPEHPYVRITVDAVIVPVEATLMAILAVTLVYASIRLFRRRVNLMTVIFLLSALVFLVAIVLIPLGLNTMGQTVIDFIGMFSRGGARGLLIGIALGTLLTGLRVLFGVDRPYGGN